VYVEEGEMRITANERLELTTAKSDGFECWKAVTIVLLYAPSGPEVVVMSGT